MMLFLHLEVRPLFFFQAEDGIRDWSVTGVQTCALPISWKVPPIGESDRLRERGIRSARPHAPGHYAYARTQTAPARHYLSTDPPRCDYRAGEIGRASCRKSVDLGAQRVIKT